MSNTVPVSHAVSTKPEIEQSAASTAISSPSSPSSSDSSNDQPTSRPGAEKMVKPHTQTSHSSTTLNPSDQQISEKSLTDFLELITEEKEVDNASMPSWEDPVSVFFSVSKPEIETSSYIRRLVRYAQCSRAAFIIGMVYLRRLEASNSKLAITPYNLHRLLTTSLMIAAKALDDRCYSNAHYARVGGIATVKELNRLELQMLALLRYNIYVSPEEYNHFVLNLRKGYVPNLSSHIARLHEAFPREARRSCATGIPPLVTAPKSRRHNPKDSASSSTTMDIDTVCSYRFDAPPDEFRVLPVVIERCSVRKNRLSGSSSGLHLGM